MSDEFLETEVEADSRFDTMYNERTTELRNVKDQLAVLQILRKTAGWKHYLELLEAQAVEREESLSLTPATGIDELVAREFPRGEAAGLRLALEIIEIEFDTLTTQVEALQAEVDRFARIDGGEND